MLWNKDLQDSELRSTLMSMAPSWWAVIGLSAGINLFALGSSIYLLLVYDRVLPSGSLVTLFGLLGIFAIVFLFHGALDVLRAYMLNDIGRVFGEKISDRLQQLQWGGRTAPETMDGSPLHHMDQIRSFLASPGPAAFIDLPWTLFFLLVLFLMHFWLGITTFFGICILAALTLFTERKTSAEMAALEPIRGKRDSILASNNRNAGTMKAMGMSARASNLWDEADTRYQEASSRISAFISLSSGSGRIFRIFIQSAVLTVGAILVIDGKATAGIIFAGSIIAGRALAPIDQAIANWRKFSAARQSWDALDTMLEADPPVEDSSVTLPAPSEKLTLDRVTLAPPGSNRVALADISFTAEAGDVIGILGPSGAGKSTLLRAIAGVWSLARGKIQLDGSTFDQWDLTVLGRHIGYLPQDVGLNTGTIAENISRFSPEPDSEAIIRAAKQAGVHDLIKEMSDGYDAHIGVDGSAISAGQQQRLGLARALFGDPFLLILDEPNSNLDPEGEKALVEAIAAAKKRGAITIMATHKLEILKVVTDILLLKNGKVAGFGKRDDILSALAQKAKG